MKRRVHRGDLVLARAIADAAPLWPQTRLKGIGHLIAPCAMIGGAPEPYRLDDGAP